MVDTKCLMTSFCQRFHFLFFSFCISFHSLLNLWKFWTFGLLASFTSYLSSFASFLSLSHITTLNLHTQLSSITFFLPSFFHFISFFLFLFISLHFSIKLYFYFSVLFLPIDTLLFIFLPNKTLEMRQPSSSISKVACLLEYFLAIENRYRTFVLLKRKKNNDLLRYFFFWVWSHLSIGEYGVWDSGVGPGAATLPSKIVLKAYILLCKQKKQL